MSALVAAVIPTETYYLILAAFLFAIGAVGVLVRRNPLVLLMCIELMLNAVNLTFVALADRMGTVDGQTVVFFVLVVASAEVVVGLGIIVSIMRKRTDVTADDLTELSGLAYARTGEVDGGDDDGGDDDDERGSLTR